MPANPPTLATIISVGGLDDYVTVGSPMVISYTFTQPVAVTTDATGTTFIDPVSITVTIVDVVGTTSTPADVRDALGQHHVSFTPVNPGLHRGNVTTTTPSGVASFEFSALQARTA